MRKGCLLLVVLSLGLTAFVPRPVLTPVSVDDYVQAQMEAWNIPGAALVIVQDGQVAEARGFGVADSGGREVTAQTPFEIGSCTKSFTALAIMQLVEQGKLELDAPVQRYIPWFRVSDADASAQITIRNLLNHSSGISQEISNQRTMVNPRGLTLEDQVRAYRDISLTAPPGAIYQYSNLNYMALGLLIEVITGKAYGDVLQQSIFAPLKMINSFSDPVVARQHGLSNGHTWWFGLPFKSLEGDRPDMLGAGYVMVSAEDMSHYLIAQLNSGRYEGTRILSPEGIASMHAPGRLSAGETIYGMGWVGYEENGLAIVNHNGKSASFSCSMFLLPERRMGVAVLVNASNLLAPHAAASLAYNIKNMLLGGNVASIDPSFWDFYFPWNIGFAVAGALMIGPAVAHLWRGRKPKTKTRALVWILFKGVIAMVFLFGIPIAKSWRILFGMFVWQPDAAYGCLLFGGILVLETLADIWNIRAAR